MAMFGLTATLAPAMGPTLGGYLTELYGWPSIFYINWVPGVLLIAGMYWGLDREPMNMQDAVQGRLARHRLHGHRPGQPDHLPGRGQFQGLVRLELHHHLRGAGAGRHPGLDRDRASRAPIPSSTCACTAAATSWSRPCCRR
jgi:hypothetical protein